MFITKKKLNQLLEEAKKEAYEKGYHKERQDGYKNGLHEGLTSEKEGVIYTSVGIYCFKDDANTVVTQ